LFNECKRRNPDLLRCWVFYYIYFDGYEHIENRTEKSGEGKYDKFTSLICNIIDHDVLEK